MDLRIPILILIVFALQGLWFFSTYPKCPQGSSAHVLYANWICTLDPLS